MGQQPGPGNGRRVRLQDVAAHAGVSTATVSLVLRAAAGPSASTRQRVLASAAALRYRPDRAASLLARRRAHLLGVVLDVRSQFHAELVEHLHVAADDRGYDILLSAVTPRHDEMRAVGTLVSSRCEALLLLAPTATARRLAELAEDVPVVAIGRRLRVPGVTVVRSSDAHGLRLVVDHLVSLGHRDIAYVDGGRGAIVADRRRGYVQAMRARGLQAHARVLFGDGTEGSGSRAADALLADGALPSAVVAFNDQIALGLLDALLRAGVTAPRDVSVVGYDDTHFARLTHVGLTSVSQEVDLQAARAVTAAVDLLEGVETDDQVVLMPRLVIRSTTGPPPSA
jgi:DNA-binding LacI/PurR family transcriptional regulator